MNVFHPFFVTIVLLCLLCGHCNLAKPTGSMTRIQEVFRTLMAAKPMMLASRGKKSLVALPREYLPDLEDEGNIGERSYRDSSYWVVADEKLPIFALPLNVRL